MMKEKETLKKKKEEEERKEENHSTWNLEILISFQPNVMNFKVSTYVSGWTFRTYWN
jgi:hypothetical protein